jgi:hypothetical protein
LFCFILTGRKKKKKKIVNGQPRPHMVGPGGPMGMNTPNMQNAAAMNGGAESECLY